MDDSRDDYKDIIVFCPNCREKVPYSYYCPKCKYPLYNIIKDSKKSSKAKHEIPPDYFKLDILKDIEGGEASTLEENPLPAEAPDDVNMDLRSVEETGEYAKSKRVLETVDIDLELDSLQEFEKIVDLVLDGISIQEAIKKSRLRS